MRYLNLILLVALMGWSWSSIHKSPSTPEWIHWNLQREIKRIITHQIATKSPYTQKIEFKKLWTESLKANKVKVFFHYSYGEAPTDSSQTQIQGYAILYRNPKESSPFWTLTEVQILNNHIVFQDGITLSPSQ